MRSVAAAGVWRSEFGVPPLLPPVPPELTTAGSWGGGGKEVKAARGTRHTGHSRHRIMLTQDFWCRKKCIRAPSS